jgi:hypothetical protein
MHFSTNNKIEARTPSDWLRVGASIGNLVNEWSFRNDLVVMLGADTATGAPALFNPTTAEIEVNIQTAFGQFTKAKEIGDFTKRMTQLEFPVAGGAIFHEALHARYSRFDLLVAHAELVRRGHAKDFNTVHMLEEGRIEAWGVRTMPHNRVLLRACAMEIVLADIREQLAGVSGKVAAANLCALTLARVDAGVLDEVDVEPIVDIVNTLLGEETIERLRDVWIRFQAHDDHTNFLPLLDLAREWNAILEEGQEPGEGEGEGEGEGKPSEGEGEGEGMPMPRTPSEGEGKDEKPLDEQAIQDILDALSDMVDDVRIDNQRDIDDAQENEEWREEREARENKQGKRRDAQKAAEKVFGRGNDGAAPNKTNSFVVETRKPNSDERIAAVKVANALDKAKYRERSVTQHNDVIPPGRLRSRAVVQGAALKAKGVFQQVEAWRSTKRKHTDNPNLRVGVMVDISGSMRSAMQPMASTAWILSEAVRRVQGKCAMVYYGQDVFATLKPGQHLDDVKVYTANDSTEKFDKAFKALDGVMDFTDSNDGARLLVVVSDGQYVYEERKAAEENLKRANQHGTAILWIDYSRQGSANAILRGTDGTVINVRPDDSQTTVANLIGKASAEVLASVGKRNG